MSSLRKVFANDNLLGKGKSVLYNEMSLGVSNTLQGRFHAQD